MGTPTTELSCCGCGRAITDELFCYPPADPELRYHAACIPPFVKLTRRKTSRQRKAGVRRRAFRRGVLAGLAFALAAEVGFWLLLRFAAT